MQIYCSNQNSCHSGLPACLRECCLHLLAVRGGAHRKKAPLLGVHGVKDTATGIALVISRNLVSRLFRYLQLQSKTGYGQGKGRDSFLCYCACADLTASAARKVAE